MERIPVSSDSLTSIGYDPENQSLEIEFNHGGVYRYEGVPGHEYEGLMNSDSKGTYFNANIKQRYFTTKL